VGLNLDLDLGRIIIGMLALPTIFFLAGFFAGYWWSEHRWR